tara:strand:+ start:336 stop:683 length:348 start_codon:yes stop_codon:yes gene_type:complete
LINFHHFDYRLIYVLQKDGKNNTRTAKISNLPNNIAKDNIHFEISETWLKLPFGPIISPKPGPTFDIAVAAPDIADKKSNPEIDSKIEIIKNINRYEKIKTKTEFIKPSSIFCLL